MSAKLSKYDRLYNQIEKLTTPINSPISRMATISAILHHKMKGYFWTGFYLLQEGELLVGPYQGPLACLRLKKDTGVCWAGINTQQTVIVDDVETFPGHIACSSLSKSEIVVPVLNKSEEIVGVLDIDSRDLSNFDKEDKEGLEKIVELIYK
ncbi:GAF domain-containing protein [Plebeiibacterium sediminum]|uniref:GAF domain-containing protein n=1 Tax=Plebeiibacterium sediminum TaxID=2992112 RepID=A0AAE3SE26_9BACT|nr:GAF domain-containing protein [Plebeiobacterium sediminum]MCW3785925.1 GAF domain-containing protein [Plebeiobacterium sediminum]